MSAQEAELFITMLAQLVKDNPHQPIALIEKNGDVLLGVMNIIPEPDDWMFDPVPIAKIVNDIVELKSAA